MKTGSAPTRLPSLDLLRGFEAAARTLSFTLAGEALHLTQSAVSRQIRELEEQLGVALFERRHRAIVLTEAGRVFYPAAVQAIDIVRAATERVRAMDAPRTIAVTTHAGLAALWLVPRLANFAHGNPGIDVRISADVRLSDLDRDGFDIGLRFCTPQLAGPGAVRLFGESVTPVCSPRLATAPKRPLREPADLARHVLLHIDDPDGAWPWLAWRTWLEAAGAHGLTPAGNMRFTNYSEVIAAARAGQGVAIGRSPLVRDALRAGELIAPFPLTEQSSRAYYMIVRPASAARAEVRAFVAWLQREAAASETSPAAKRTGRRRGSRAS